LYIVFWLVFTSHVYSQKRIIDTIYVNNLLDSCKLILKKNNDSVVILAKKALEISGNLNFTNGKINSYYYLAESNQFSGNYNESKAFYLQALEICQDNNLNKKKEIYNRLGWLCVLMSDYGAAVSYADKVIDNPVSTESDKAIAYNTKASAFTYIGNNKTALELYFLALKIHENQNYEKGIGYTYNNIAAIYFNQKDYENAYIYFKKTEKILIQVKDFYQISSIKNNIGAIFLRTKQYDSAQIYFDKALEHAIALENTTEHARIESNLGLLFIEKKQLSHALPHLNEAVKLYQKLGNKTGLSILYMVYGTYFSKTGNFKKAIEYAKLAFNEAVTSESKNEEAEALKDLAEYAEKLGRISDAYNYLTKYQTLSDSLLNSELLQTTENMRMVYETEKHENQIAILSANEKIKDSEIYRKKIIICVLSFAFVIIAIFGVILFIFNRNIKQAYTKLVEKNIEELKINSEQKLEKKAPTEKELTEKELLISENLEKILEEEKIYTNENLNLDDLAKLLNTNRAILSKIINQKYNCNFNSFINQYRVKEVCKLLTQNKHENLTIEGIAKSVGFANRATFNSSFKKFVGVTPSFYIASLTK